MNNVYENYRDAGIKLTPQRLAILKFLEGNTSHPSAEDIFNAIKGDFPTLSFATVYNTIDSLRKGGRILELSIDPSRKHYDPNTEPHHHIICSSCGRIGDIFDDSIEIDLARLKPAGFTISSWSLHFSGTCDTCRKRN